MVIIDDFGLSKKEIKVIKVMNKTLRFEEISEKTNMPLSKLNFIIDSLVNKGLVAESKNGN